MDKRVRSYEAFFRQELHSREQTINELQQENAELYVKAYGRQKPPKVSVYCAHQSAGGEQDRGDTTRTHARLAPTTRAARGFKKDAYLNDRPIQHPAAL
jgi:hypothetical protein